MIKWNEIIKLMIKINLKNDKNDKIEWNDQI